MRFVSSSPLFLLFLSVRSSRPGLASAKPNPIHTQTMTTSTGEWYSVSQCVWNWWRWKWWRDFIDINVHYMVALMMKCMGGSGTNRYILLCCRLSVSRTVMFHLSCDRSIHIRMTMEPKDENNNHLQMKCRKQVEKREKTKAKDAPPVHTRTHDSL